MTKRAVVRATKPYSSAESALLHLFSINENDHETLVVTSSLIPEVAAADICRLLEQPFTIAPSVDSLKEVFQIPGRTAWASATASDARAATQQVCLQHDMRTAQGVLVMVTLSPNSRIVESLKSAMNVIRWETPYLMERALVVGHDEGLCGQVRVDVLMVGLMVAL